MKSFAPAQAMAMTIMFAGRFSTAPLAGAIDETPRVSVVFVEPDRFTDASDSEMERSSRAILLRLERFIVYDAPRYLPQSMRLEIRITDIDLAGDIRLFRDLGLGPVRVNRSIFPPRLVLQFRITEANQQTVKEGQRHLSDLDYQLRVEFPRQDYLRYEKGLLAVWLRNEFGPLRSGRTD